MTKPFTREPNPDMPEAMPEETRDVLALSQALLGEQKPVSPEGADPAEPLILMSR
ncbi:hypothetical protein Q3U31_004655 [Salmonella enterica subsp. enterica serovar Montevideo]|nr:hypothetical protein [Salmonella enterica subsp. enterica serovar Montevideo]